MLGSSSSYFATTTKGAEEVLAGELGALGAQAIVPQPGGVGFAGPEALLYRANLWLRTATRVLVPLARFPCDRAEALYEGTRALPWHEHLTPDMTLAVDASVRDSALTHSRYVALKTKDAIVDQIRDRVGARPSVDPRTPCVRISVHLARDMCTISLDASDRSLHERGYRVAGGPAPLKESLAAALVLLSGYRPEQPFLDPMCGTGTLLIEAALLATDRAPGLGRDFGFERWRTFRSEVWRDLKKEARARHEAALAGLAGTSPLLYGSDHDARALAAAHENAAAAGIAKVLTLRRGAFEGLEPPEGAGPGLMLMNPPYGERLGERKELAALYIAIGDRLKHHFAGWTACIFTGDPALAKSIGLRTSRRTALFNGPIECRLLRYEMY